MTLNPKELHAVLDAINLEIDYYESHGADWAERAQLLQNAKGKLERELKRVTELYAGILRGDSGSIL